MAHIDIPYGAYSESSKMNYSFNVRYTTWKERKDVQKRYPEVAKGNLVNMTKWTMLTGWT